MADVINNLASGLEQAITQAVQNAMGSQQQQAPTQQSQAQINANKNAVTSPHPVDVKTPMPKVGGMKTGEYQNPYQQQQQQLTQQLGNTKLYETPQQTKDLMKGLFVSQTEKYNYAAENDPLVIQARKNLEQSVTNMVAKRGFGATSSVNDLVTNQMTKMIPQFESIARGEHADFLSNQLNLANTMMQWEQIQFDRSKDQIQLITTKIDTFNKMSDRDFQIFKSMLDQRNANRTMYLQLEEFKLSEKLQENKMALQRLENLGYVDEETSITLGVPIGTKAKWAQKLAMEQTNKLALMAQENEYNLKKQQLDADLEKELYTLKNKLDLDSQLKLEAMTYEYKKQLQDIEFKKEAELLRLQQEAEAAAAAAAASRRSSGGGSSRKSGSSKTTSTKTLSNTQLDKQYKIATKVMEPRVHDYYANNWGSGLDYITLDNARSQVANDLNELYKQGIDPAIIAQLRRQYGV